MRLELLNMDVVVLEYEYDEELHAVTGVARLVAPEFAPPACVSGDGSVTAADLAWWWRHRGIPASRPRLERLLETVGLDSVSELVERAMALSLSDRYLCGRLEKHETKLGARPSPQTVDHPKPLAVHFTLLREC